MNKDAAARYFRDLPELTTPRLILRRLKKTDYQDMYEYARDPLVTKFLTWHIHPSENYTLRYIVYVLPKYRSGEFRDWAVICKENNKMIGTCGFTSLDFSHNSGEIGYVLNRDYWGQGLAPEAIKAVMNVGFNDFNLHRIEAKYIEGNERSRRVMEKCGMTFEGLERESMFIKESYRTIGICSILRSEYLNE